MVYTIYYSVYKDFFFKKKNSVYKEAETGKNIFLYLYDSVIRFH